MRFVHGPLHGEVRALPRGTKRHKVPALEGRSLRCYVYVPHPTYPDTCMILDSQASGGDFAFLTHNPDVLVMNDCGTTEVTLLGEYTGKMFDVESVVKQLDAHYAEYAQQPAKIELTTVLTR